MLYLINKRDNYCYIVVVFFIGNVDVVIYSLVCFPHKVTLTFLWKHPLPGVLLIRYFLVLTARQVVKTLASALTSPRRVQRDVSVQRGT